MVDFLLDLVIMVKIHRIWVAKKSSPESRRRKLGRDVRSFAGRDVRSFAGRDVWTTLRRHVWTPHGRDVWTPLGCRVESTRHRPSRLDTARVDSFSVRVDSILFESTRYCPSRLDTLRVDSFRVGHEIINQLNCYGS